MIVVVAAVFLFYSGHKWFVSRIELIWPKSQLLFITNVVHKAGARSYRKSIAFDMTWHDMTEINSINYYEFIVQLYQNIKWLGSFQLVYMLIKQSEFNEFGCRIEWTSQRMKTWSNWTPSFAQKLTTNHYMKVSFNFIKCSTNFTSVTLFFIALNDFIFVMKTLKYIESTHFDHRFKGDFVMFDVVVVCCCNCCRRRKVCCGSFAKGNES